MLHTGGRRMIEAAARGEWRELEARLRPFIARRMRAPADVDDVVQDVFLRMQRGLADLRDDERFGAWVYRIARSAIVDHQRLQSKHRVLDAAGEAEPQLATEGDDDDRSAEEEVAAYAAFLVATLPSPYREALTLTELEGLTQKQAAEMLGISVSGMKSRVQRGRALLRKELDDCCRIALDVRGHVLSCEVRETGPAPSCRCN